MNVAVVGIGYWGSKLLRNLVPLIGAERVIAVDLLAERVSIARDHYPAIGVAQSLDAVLDDERVAAVIIATPAETHADLARRALHAGRHVLVEKPLTRSVAEAEQLVRDADAASLVLMVGHTFLFSPKVIWTARYIADGRLGKIHYLTSSRLNLGGHNHHTNVMWDLCPHDLSIAFHLLGELPTSVQALARSTVGSEVPDVAFLTLEFPSGAIASINVSWRAPRKVRNTTLVGDAGMIIYDDNDNEEPVKVYDKGVVVTETDDFGNNQLSYRHGDMVAPHIPAVEPLTEELAYFISAVERGHAAVRSGGELGLEVVRALEAADRSWRDGGRPVNLDVDAHRGVETPLQPSLGMRVA